MKTMLYAVIVYAIVLFAGLYINQAHGEQRPIVARTDSTPRTAPNRTCSEYLNICEISCKDRGKMARFLCLGADFNFWKQNRYNCECFDEIGITSK
jgi:outer membrane receptor for Fe3+-dicitrate